MPTDGPAVPATRPIRADGGPHGALVLHGFTGSPHSIRGVAEALAATGMAVEAPLFPGHGTSMDDMLTTTWDDWYGAVGDAFRGLAARVDRVVVVGLSMGGALGVTLAADHPDGVAGIAAVNPMIDPPAPSFRDILREMLSQGITVIPTAGGTDIAAEDIEEASYSGTPVRPLLSLCEALDRLSPRLPSVTCPLLILTSPQDHVVPPVSSDVLAAGVSGPVERVWLENSYHVATLDVERAEVERRIVEFATKVAWS